MMDGDSPYQISRLQHSLQTATRAEKDGADEETIVCALLHDIGDVISPSNHSQVSAALLRPYINDKKLLDSSSSWFISRLLLDASL